MRELEYPFDSEYLLKKKRSIKKALLSEGEPFTDKKIAVFGGRFGSHCGRVDERL